MTRPMIPRLMRIGLDWIGLKTRLEGETDEWSGGIARAQYEPTMPVNGGGRTRVEATGERGDSRARRRRGAEAANANANANARDESYANRENDGGRSGNKDRVRPMMVDETPVKRVKTARGGAKTPASVGRRTAESAKTARRSRATARPHRRPGCDRRIISCSIGSTSSGNTTNTRFPRTCARRFRR